MAELADALASGASVLTDVQVQPLFRAPHHFLQTIQLIFILLLVVFFITTIFHLNPYHLLQYLTSLSLFPYLPQ